MGATQTYGIPLTGDCSTCKQDIKLSVDTVGIMQWKHINNECSYS